MIEQIFIGGTGRSGTTILSKVLGRHHDIYRYPFETRFIIDPDGLIDLVPALSDEWSPWKADVAVRRFRRMMWEIYPPKIRRTYRKIAGQVFPKIGISPPRYALWRSYGDIIPRKEFTGIVSDFLGALTYREIRGYWVGTSEYGFRPKIIGARWFERKEIMKISGDFVNSISSYPMKKEGKQIWLDHTPLNLIHASFLHKMFPEMRLIHVYRDPRDVISSYKTKSWGGNSALDNTLWIKGILEKWEEEKKKIPKDVYYEVRMEDMIRNPEKELKKLMAFLGLDFDKKMMDIDLTKGHIGRWKKDLKQEEIKVIEETLGDIIGRYRYMLKEI